MTFELYPFDVVNLESSWGNLNFTQPVGPGDLSRVKVKKNSYKNTMSLYTVYADIGTYRKLNTIITN